MIHYSHPIVQRDLADIVNSPINWKKLNHKTILVTGATGMLASYFSFLIKYLIEVEQAPIQLRLLARSKEKLQSVFGDETPSIRYHIQDICTPITSDLLPDYIFHAAGGASPVQINTNPVGIIQANTIGTINVLELARQSAGCKVMFTSTREVYGKTEGITQINETDMGTLNPMDERACYPESKRIAESLLRSYASQYGVTFNSLRIAHSYGPGMQIKNDGRVMADFLDTALKGEDIKLHTSGEAERAFCYITDAISAIFSIMLEGIENEAYNIANETEPISIVKLAHLIQELSENHKAVRIPKSSHIPKGYCNYQRTMLSTKKLEGLGWQAKTSLRDGILKTLRSLR